MTHRHKGVIPPKLSV